VNILITICARGGSKGIPGKNVKHIAGKPLIAYTIQLANKLKAKWDVKVALSTEEDEIKTVASMFGLFSTYKRPDFLSTDSAGKIDTISDLLLFEESLVGFKYDYVLDLDVTSPLRTLEDIEKALEILITNKKAKNIFSVNQASRNPYFNMVEKNLDGFYILAKSNSDGSVMTRQTAPKVYELNASFYWYKRSFFELGEKSAITDASLIYEMNHVCFDLDHPIDFLFLEFLILNNKIDFII
jgi:CMP-N,N'-diacetyllegionaminic acid synthase